MKVALAFAAKQDNNYLKEYVEHYLSIGINTIILIDNNEINGENPGDVLKDFTDRIVYLDRRGDHTETRQWDYYTRIYRDFNTDFDWICFFDSDEYLFLKEHKTIQDWLSMTCFDEVDVVAPNWKMYSDNNLIYYDNRPVIERFRAPCPIDIRAGYNFPHNNHTKSIIHCRSRNDIVFRHPHFAESTTNNSLVTVNSVGQEMHSGWPFCDYNFKYAELRHYQTKSTEEFCYRRLSPERNFCMRRFDSSEIDINKEIEYYFMLNEFSEEKMAFIKQFLSNNH